MSLNSLVFKDYRGTHHTINVTDIVYVEAKYKGLIVRTADYKSWIIDGTLKSLSEDIGKSFIFINRMYLVNKTKITHISRVNKTQWEVVTKDIPARLPISRRRLDSVLRETKAV